MKPFYVFCVAALAALSCTTPALAQYQNPGDLPDAPGGLTQAQLDARAPVEWEIGLAHEYYGDCILAHGQLVHINDQLKDLRDNTDPDCPYIDDIQAAIDALTTQAANANNSILQVSSHLSWKGAYNFTAAGDTSAQGWAALYASAASEGATIRGITWTLRDQLEDAVDTKQELLDLLTALVTQWEEEQEGF